MALVDLLRVVNAVATLQHGARARTVSWCLVDEFGTPLPPVTAHPLWHALLEPHAGVDGRDISPTLSADTRRACFIPPFSTHNVPALRQAVQAQPSLINAVQGELNQGRQVLMLGNGAWFAAGSIQAATRSFVLPWFFMAAFMKDFPAARTAAHVDFVGDGPFVSAGTLGSLVDALLLLLARAYDVEFIQTLRSALLFDETRQSTAIQAQREGLLTPTRDSVVALAMRWVDTHLADRFDLAALAAACSVSERTLLRHFDQVLGQPPLQYLHAQRCKRACYLLESTLDSVLTIAQACGYVETSGFRKVFIRHTGLTPQRYRSQRSLRAPRKRWKAEAAKNIGKDPAEPAQVRPNAGALTSLARAEANPAA